MKHYLSNDNNEMANAVYAVFGNACMALEILVFNKAGEQCAEYNGGSWGFVCNDERTLGFWYPLGQETYPVSVPTNYYENATMPAMAFGAGLTLLAVNLFTWDAHSRGNQALADKLSRQYHELTTFVFDLAEQKPPVLDGAAVAGFID